MQKPRVYPLFIILCSVLFTAGAFAQSAVKPDLSGLKSREDSLTTLANSIVLGRDPADRFRSDSAFTRMLVRALKTNYSFYYPFDSLQSISKLYAPDSSFRIFTWQVVRDESMHRRHGAIQMNTPDGSLKLFPLIDRSALIQNTFDTITNNEWWIGSIYYKVIQKENNGKKFYTLLGYDENTMRSTKKRIEVLTFDRSSMPVFGGMFFSFAEDTVRKNLQSRFWIEFKKDGNARMQYDPELDMIIYDHLISESNEPNKKYTLIPDGDYEGFKWKDGRWVHVEKVFTFKLKDGEAPVGVPLSDNKFSEQLPHESNAPVKSKPKKSGN